MCIRKTAVMLHKKKRTKVTAYSIACEHPGVHSTVLSLAQQSSENYSEVCERQKYGELWIKRRSCASGFFLLIDFFEFKTKNAFVATALLNGCFCCSSFDLNIRGSKHKQMLVNSSPS